ncbi:MAG: lysophospholipid acyltransferase family protein [bacterium]|nr:lysophospholipid acyltransferase family protein [bacterium]
MVLFLKDIFRWMFWFPLRNMLTVLPLPVAYTVGTWLGYVYYGSAGRRRKKTKTELLSLTVTTQLDQKTINRIVREAMVSLVLNYIDIMLYPKLARVPVEYYTEVEGLQELQSALQKNQGVILAHPHFGNPQLLMPALGYRNFRINQVGRALPTLNQIQSDTVPPLGLPPMSPTLNRILNLIHQLEQTLPAKYIYIHQTLLPAFRCLKKNEIVAIAIDGLAGDNRVLVDVAGRVLSLSTGPIAMAMRTGAPLLPTFVLRTAKKYIHKIIIEPPLALQNTGNESADLELNTRKFAERIAYYLVTYPEQIARLFGSEPPYFTEISAAQLQMPNKLDKQKSKVQNET